MKVLVVDDNALNRELAQTVLSLDGLDVRCAEDAEQGLAVADAWQPTLVLADVQLPGMDGLEMTRLLKAGATPPVVLAWTAYAMAGDEARMLAAGCDSYIAKPIDIARFAQQVRRAAEQALARRA